MNQPSEHSDEQKPQPEETGITIQTVPSNDTSPTEPTERVIPYAPVPVYAQIGAATMQSGQIFVVLEFQTPSGDQAYFMPADYAQMVFQAGMKMCRTVMSKEAQVARLVGPTGEALIK